MEKGCKILEFRTGSGELLFSIRVIVKNESDPEPQEEKKTPDKEKGGNGKKDEERKGDNSGTNDQPMTDAQKRYLFRILADQGFEKEAANDELKKAFGVDSLKKVTKIEASREIERRLALSKGGAANG
jgi:hypothetical protein